ncbi:TPA: hypothetical protein ACSTJ2_004605 [Serratia fonticola]
MDILKEISLDRLIALIASIGACLSAIAAFLSVRQTIKQRKLSYIPEIIIQPISYYIKGMSTKKIPPHAKKIQRLNSENDSAVGLHLENIGLGSAVHLKYKWLYSPIVIVSEINEILSTHGEHITIDLKDDYLKIESNDGSSVFYNMPEREQVIDYILPINNEKSPRYIYAPNAYLELYSLLTLLKFDSIIALRGVNTPKPILELTYSDIGGAIIKKRLELAIKPSMYKKYPDGLDYSATITLSNIQ